jgi:hypothetical protein
MPWSRYASSRQTLKRFHPSAELPLKRNGNECTRKQSKIYAHLSLYLSANRHFAARCLTLGSSSATRVGTLLYSLSIRDVMKNKPSVLVHTASERNCIIFAVITFGLCAILLAIHVSLFAAALLGGFTAMMILILRAVEN